MSDDLFPDTVPDPESFAGTENPRQLRAIEALERGPVLREELDAIAGCSNAPELVADLRRLGLDIACERVERIDRDGRPCKPGRYFLTEKGHAQLRRYRGQ